MMNLLLDTHILLWAADNSKKLSKTARQLLSSEENTLFFSVASLWEVMIKTTLRRPDFQVDAAILKRGLTDSGYLELPILSKHVLALNTLPDIHKDPFDRILIAQASVEGMSLVSADPLIAKYKSSVILV